MTTDAIWITEADVVGLMDLKEAIAALEAALRAEARGEAQSFCFSGAPRMGRSSR